MTNLKSLSRPNRILKTNDPTSRLLSLTHRKRKKEKKDDKKFHNVPINYTNLFFIRLPVIIAKKKKIPTSPHFIAAEYYLESEARSTDRCMTGI